jgi:hypothetical protein
LESPKLLVQEKYSRSLDGYVRICGEKSFQECAVLEEILLVFAWCGFVFRHDAYAYCGSVSGFAAKSLLFL